MEKSIYRKIRIIIMALIVALSATLPVYAESYTVGHGLQDCSSDICGVHGDSINQVNRTCKICHTRTVYVYCVGGNTKLPDVACTVGNHSRPCTITNRIAGIANAYCTYCGSYHFDAGDFKVYDFEGHVDSCYHTSTQMYYNTCTYGPRE